jgi:alkylation response protein AidB-like acyl-CoA dehydrogenase
MSDMTEQSAGATIRPFHVNVPEAELTELRRRINATRWPDRETVTDQSQGVQLALTHAVQSAVQAVELMYRMAGTSGVYTRSPLERYFRDVQVLRHHAFGAETRYETVGQVYLGLPPDFPVLAF